MQHMTDEIDAVEKLLYMHLASSQNRLVRAEVSFTMLTTWVTVGVVIFNFLGMNLHSGLEWNEAGPWSPHTRTQKGPSWNFLASLTFTLVTISVGCLLTWGYLLRIGILLKR